jgi:hypothetical protein
MNGQPMTALIMAAAAIFSSLLQAGALFFWAGKLTQKSSDHGDRIKRLEDHLFS